MDFIDDKEKMRDFYKLSKDEFLEMYSYITEQEYNNTRKKVKLFNDYNRVDLEIENFINYLTTDEGQRKQFNLAREQFMNEVFEE